MNDASISEKVKNALVQGGFRGCIVPIDRLSDLEAEYEVITSRDVWRRSPHLSQHRFEFKPPSDFPARSIIVVAAPVTPVRLGFAYHGNRYSFEAPPLSGDYDLDVARTIKTITDVIGPSGYHLADSNLPTKVLASHTGLLQNGINNMGYIPGMGSFFRLTSFFSDLPTKEKIWEEVHTVAPICRDCGICIEACPTGCISHEVYNVSRCLSLLSKEPSDFPDWVKNKWHNSIIGCRVCQQVCPMNRSVIDETSNGAEFSEAETEAILSGVPIDELEQSTRDKLRYFHLVPFHSLLPRNLRLLLDKTGETA